MGLTRDRSHGRHTTLSIYCRGSIQLKTSNQNDWNISKVSERYVLLFLTEALIATFGFLGT